MALGVAWARTGEPTTYALVNKGVGILVLIASFYMVVTLANSAGRPRHIVTTLLVSVGVVNIVSLAAYSVWLYRGVLSPVVYGLRLTGFLIDPNAYGGLLAVALLIQLGVLVGGTAKLRWVRYAGAVNALLIGAGLALSRSRSAWLAFAVGGLILVWLCRHRLTWRRVLFAGVAIACTAAVLWLLAGSMIVSLLKEALQPTTIVQRWDQVSGGLSVFPRSPIWGIGLDAYRQLGSQFIIHNTYVWFLVEMGVIGFAVLVALLTRVSRDWAAALRSTGSDWGLAVGGTAAFAAMLGLAVGIEALYQRPLWLLFALAEVLRRTAIARASASPQARADEAQ
jgi:O-antigen ligase